MTGLDAIASAAPASPLARLVLGARAFAIVPLMRHDRGKPIGREIGSPTMAGAGVARDGADRRGIGPAARPCANLWRGADARDDVAKMERAARGSGGTKHAVMPRPVVA